MTFVILTHDDCLGHVTPPGHPERVERLQAVNAALSDPAFAAVPRIEAPLAEDGPILRAHPAAYMERIESSEPEQGWTSLDPDTHMSPGSVAAARRAAGANVKAVDMVMGGEAKIAFCAARPPGHHAEQETPMGFCLYANAAIAALHAIEAHGAARVAVADFDVHHGNGTQAIFWDDPRVVLSTSQQFPLWPGTDRESEVGAGNIFNGTIPPGGGGAAFRKVWEDRLLPGIDAHEPDLIVISAGFDAHARDPLAELNLLEEDFIWITERLCDLADKHCQGRVVSTLEGGYDLEALASSTAAHCRVLMERAG